MSNPSFPNYPQDHNQPYPDGSGGLGGPVPSWAPYYGASLTVAVKRFFQKYATFSGRASRSEYWWWTLVSILVNIFFIVLDATFSDNSFRTGDRSLVMTILSALWGLATFLPSIAVAVRRLHDTNKSGWWYALILFPILGPIAVFILTLLPSDPAGRRYDDPDDRPTPTNNRGPAFG